MRYTVLDTSSLSVQHADRAMAESSRDQLAIDNPDADWKVYVAVAPMDDSKLEALYALASMLLTESKLNPIRTGLQISKLDGTIEERSLLSVMHQAREQLDQRNL